MTPKDCPQSEELREYVQGRLESPECDHVASHLETCLNCEETAASFDEATDPLLRLLLQKPQTEKFAGESDLAEAIRLGKSLSSAAPTSKVAADHPQQLREYKLLEKLGEGGMGAVYRALHTKLDKTVALKILPEDRMRHTGAVERFEREMKAVGRLDHPNIVRASDAGQFEETHFLVMEFVDGIDLSELVKRAGPLPVSAACEIIRQAAIGLSHAHGNGMVHRDIKPHNLMVTGDGTVKILDLGLALIDEPVARQRDGITSSGQIMGTLDYMAPEQIEDSHYVDHRADIYSLGATLYKLLAGDAPFSDSRYSSPLKLMMALVNDPPLAIGQRCENLPDGFVEILERIMAKKPEDRFALANEVAESLAEFCNRRELAELVQRAGVVGSSVVDRHPSDPTLSEAGYFASRASKQAEAVSPMWQKPAFRIGVVAVGLLAALALAMLVILRMKTPHGEVVVSFEDGVDRDQVRIEVQGNDRLKIADADNDWTIEVDEGTYNVRLLGGDDRFRLNKDELEVIRDGKAFLTVQLLPLKPDTKTDAPMDGASADKKTEREIAEWVLTQGGTVGVFEGDVPTGLSALVSLPTMFKPGQILELPDELRLSVIYLRGIPDLRANEISQLNELKNLRTLDVSSANFTDEHLAALHLLPELTTLRLAQTKVTNASAKRLETFSTLKVLDVRATQIGDDAMPAISRLGDLKILHLGETSLTDVGFAHLSGKLRNLLSLSVSGTSLSDECLLLVTPENFPSLTGMSAMQTEITKEAIASAKHRHPRCLIVGGIRSGTTP